MKESYGKSLANHPDPESCGASREAVLEALTGAHVGRVIELRNQCDQSADGVDLTGRPHLSRRLGEPKEDSAQSKTPCMHGNSTRENREASGLSRTQVCGTGWERR